MQCMQNKRYDNPPMSKSTPIWKREKCITTCDTTNKVSNRCASKLSRNVRKCGTNHGLSQHQWLPAVLTAHINNANMHQQEGIDMETKDESNTHKYYHKQLPDPIQVSTLSCYRIWAKAHGTLLASLLYFFLTNAHCSLKCHLHDLGSQCQL